MIAAFAAVIALVQGSPAMETVTLAAHTPVRLTTDGTIDSRSIRQGQRFALTVADDVIIGSKIVIPRGAPAAGEIESLSEKGMFGKSARFALRPLYVDVAGQRVNLTGTSERKGKDAVAAAAITTVLTNGLGLFITGKSAVLPAGSSLSGEVRNDVTITLLPR
jgi:hypothetical protein